MPKYKRMLHQMICLHRIEDGIILDVDVNSDDSFRHFFPYAKGWTVEKVEEVKEMLVSFMEGLD